jgi:hypothetical protein
MIKPVIGIVVGCAISICISLWAPVLRGDLSVTIAASRSALLLGLFYSAASACMIPGFSRRIKLYPSKMAIVIPVLQVLQGFNTRQLLHLHKYIIHPGWFEYVCELTAIVSFTLTCFYYTTNALDLLCKDSAHSRRKSNGVGATTTPIRHERRIQSKTAAPLRRAQRTQAKKVGSA